MRSNQVPRRAMLRWRWETEGVAYYYASSTQPPSIAGCRRVSFPIQNALGNLADTEPGLQSSLTT